MHATHTTQEKERIARLKKYERMVILFNEVHMYVTSRTTIQRQYPDHIIHELSIKSQRPTPNMYHVSISLRVYIYILFVCIYI